MGNDLTVDLGDLLKLAEDLEGAQQRIEAAVEPIIKRGAQNIKTETQRRLRGILTGRGMARSGGQRLQRLSSARAYVRSISYDVTADDGRVEAEIGPDKTMRQGALGNLLEYGSSNNPPYPHLRPAAEAEQPRTERELLRAAVKAALGGD